MSTVAINHEILSWARDRSGLPVDKFTKKFPKFDKWETGDAQPTLNQLEQLAKMTMTPLGYFFLQEPPEDRLPIPDFRTVKDEPLRRPSPNLLETIQIMQRRQNWMRDFMIEEGEDRLPFVGSVALDSRISEVARDIRKTLLLDEHWAAKVPTWREALATLREAVENARILIVLNSVIENNTHRKLDVDEFRGFILHDEYAPLIFVNGADYEGAKMFTVAHELAHVWLGKGGIFNLDALEPADNDVERFCNKVAAEFLIPENLLRESWTDAKQAEDPFQAIARRFKVSALVAARRLLDLGFVNRNRFFEFLEQYRTDERRKKTKKPEGGDFYNTQNVRVGKRFASAVIRAAKEGRLLYREAYALTGLYGNTFDSYAKALGFKG